MKINPEHFEYLREAITPAIDAQTIENYETGKFPRSEHTKDLNKRFRWDAMYACVSSRWVCENLYPYLNDTHIDTALKRIIPTINRRY